MSELLTDEDERRIEYELAKPYLEKLEAHRQSKGFSEKPKLPTLDDVTRAKLKAQNELTLKNVGEWAIRERQQLQERKAEQKLKKPNDTASQIIMGAKIKAFQQVINKWASKGKMPSEEGL